MEISNTSKMLAGVILVTVPTIEYGGSFLLGMLRRAETGYVDNDLRHDLFRAGHAHAGVMVLFVIDLPAFCRRCNPARLAHLDCPPGRPLRSDPDADGILSVGCIAASYRADANDPARVYRRGNSGGGDLATGSRADPCIGSWLARREDEGQHCRSHDGSRSPRRPPPNQVRFV